MSKKRIISDTPEEERGGGTGSGNRSQGRWLIPCIGTIVSDCQLIDEEQYNPRIHRNGVF